MTGTPPPPAGPASAKPSGGEPLPPDPVRYDHPRNEHARRRGLPAPYIAGGDDPDLEETLRRERRDRRLLVLMIVVLVSTGFVLGILGAIIGIVTR